MKIFFIALIITIVPQVTVAQSITNNVHNLSVSGPGTITAATESEVCIFCHTPHGSSPGGPLWNRADPGSTYTLYNSSTAQAVPGQPSGSSILCLSCHDGTIALGSVLSRSTPIEFSGGVTTLPTGPSNLSTNLSDDHPISFVYDPALAAANGELEDPTLLVGSVVLENGQLQCTACHDPHNDSIDDFLVESTRFSTLCTTCHTKDFWILSSHKTSGAVWDGSGLDPWFHTPYTTVAENACENCHNPHNASGNARLMNYLAEESNCLSCHNSSVAATDIQSMLLKAESHDVYGYAQIHDPVEASTVQLRHVECEDCHNPHASRNFTAFAPDANGFISGVKGVDTNGNPIDPIRYEYELCYRCHADSPDKPGSPTSRLVDESNVRFEFDLSNASYHPIEGQGKNSNVPSLIFPYSESSIIYCIDCHASDGANDPAGPHGSIYPQILKYNYERGDNVIESPFTYELCYQCHDRSVILDKSTEFGKDVHNKHITEENATCNTCHDPHGVNSAQGSLSDLTHLVNFDISIVSSNNSGRLEFRDLGNFSGACYLQCHGKNHDPKSYGPGAGN